MLRINTVTPSSSNPQTPVLGRNQSLVCGTQDEETHMTRSPGMGLEGMARRHGISSFTDFLFLKPQNGSCEVWKQQRATGPGVALQMGISVKEQRSTVASDQEPAWMRKESAGTYVERWRPVLDMPTYTPGTLNQPPSISLDKIQNEKNEELVSHEYVWLSTFAVHLRPSQHC